MGRLPDVCRVMRILMASPAPPGSQAGNNVTAARWAKLLAELGHQVLLSDDLSEHWDVLVALHARRSHELVARARTRHPERPVVVALTGTDLYQDLPAGSGSALESLGWADRIIVLQPLAREGLAPELRAKTRVILQSAEAPVDPPPPEPGIFEVCVLGHLRPVKDPFRAAEAARLLPTESRVMVTQVGAALSADATERARSEMKDNPRYRWLGELPRPEALRVLARSRLLALTSISEGGANVISEALAAGTPVVSSRIPGSVGLLGPDYPGYFAAGATSELAALLARAEADRAFYARLSSHCEELAPTVRPDRERAAWAELLREL